MARRIFVFSPEIIDSTAVGEDDIVVSPAITQDIDQ
jgi:hypothetical protein